MSSNQTQAETVGVDSFQSEVASVSDAHRTAFFNPVPDLRAKALKQIRASSGWSPSAWRTLDAAAGVAPVGEDGEREELEAAAGMPYRMGVDFDAGDGLSEQFIRSGVVDTLVSSGFARSANLSSYGYLRPLKSGRMEADTTMNTRTESRQNVGRDGIDGVPLPVNIVTYELDSREMEVRRTYGEDPEAQPAMEARRALNRREHEILFNGWGGTFTVGGMDLSLGGLDSANTDRVLQAPNSSGWQDPTVLLSDINAFHSTVEGQSNDVIDEDDVPLVAQVGGMVMVPLKLWGEIMREDYESSATDESLRQRLNTKYPYLQFVPAPRLDSDTAILLLNDPRYFGIVNAQGVTNTSWSVDGGAAMDFRVLSSRIPWVREQPDGIKGVVRMTGVSGA